MKHILQTHNYFTKKTRCYMIGLSRSGYTMKPGDKIGNDRIAFVWDGKPIPELESDPLEDDSDLALLDELNLHLIFTDPEKLKRYILATNKEGEGTDL